MARVRHRTEAQLERNRVKCREWRQANLDTARAFDRARYPQRKAAMTESDRERQRVYARVYQKRRRLADFGLSGEQFDQMLQEQDNKCPVCLRVFEDYGGPSGARAANVDHDHITGAVRGLLCGWCNLGLGKLGDTEAAVQRLLDYLKKAKRR